MAQDYHDHAPSLVSLPPDCKHRESQTRYEQIRMFCKNGQLDRALNAASLLERLYGSPSGGVYVSLLKACSKAKSLPHTKRVQALISCGGVEARGVVGDYLAVALAKCGAINDAHAVFFDLPLRTVFSWTAMISGYTESCQGWEALKLHNHMQEDGVVPNEYTFVGLLKACATVSSLHEAMKVHTNAQIKDFTSYVFVGNSLVSVYGKCGSIKEAEIVFDRLVQRDTVSWNAMLTAYVEQDHSDKAFRLYRQMHKERFLPNNETGLIILRACDTLLDKGEALGLERLTSRAVSMEVGRAIHADARKKGFSLDAFLASSLVHFYGKCGSIVEAENVFVGLLEYDVVSWNAILLAYVEQRNGVGALQLYKQMLEGCVCPNPQIFMMTFQACGVLANCDSAEGHPIKSIVLEIGRALQFDAQSQGFLSDAFVGSSLVSMYGKCKSIVEAEDAFASCFQYDIVLWNALLSAYLEHGLGEKAMKLYRQMQEQGVPFDQQTLMIILQAFGGISQLESVSTQGLLSRKVALEIGKALHADVRRMGLDSNVSVSNTLLIMYGRCASLMEAKNVFVGLSKHNVASWGAMLSSFVQCGLPENALQCYRCMQEEGIRPNRQIFLIMCQACSNLLEREDIIHKNLALEIVQATYCDALKTDYSSNMLVGNAFLSLYGKFGRIIEAESLFAGLLERDGVSWNSMLSAYVEQGHIKLALCLYRQMQEDGVTLNQQTFMIIIQACSAIVDKEDSLWSEGHSNKLVALEIGTGLHADVRKKGLALNLAVGSSLIGMYGKCGSILEAENVFDNILEHDLVSWSVMLSAYVDQQQQGKALQIFEQMHKEGLKLNPKVFLIALQACSNLLRKDYAVREDCLPVSLASLDIGRALQFDAERAGLTSDPLVGNALVSMYGNSGSIAEAENVFDGLCNRDVVSWNTMLSAYVNQGQNVKALLLFRQMQEERVKPKQQTLVLTFQACCALVEQEDLCGRGWPLDRVKMFEIGKTFHANAYKQGFASDTRVGNSLITMYGKCGGIVEAEHVFDGLLWCDVVSWTAMIAMYLEHGQQEMGLQMYRQMQEEGTSPNQHTFVVSLLSCGALLTDEDAIFKEGKANNSMPLEIGQALHADACRKGLASDRYVGSTLVSMYGKCGSVEKAKKTFDALSDRNIVSWNSMLSAYLNQDNRDKALKLYREMQLEAVVLDDIAVMGVLQASSEEGSIDVCMQLHFNVVSADLDSNPLVMNSLIRAYGNCGSMVDGQAVFDGLPRPSIVSWNACIAGYAQEGNSLASLELFEEMQLAGLIPSGATFLSVLSACCHSSLVKEGAKHLQSMCRDSSVSPNLQHYLVIMDLFWRAGDFENVENFILGIPMQADSAVSVCLLAACRLPGSIELGKHAFDYAAGGDFLDPAIYVLMSNLYANLGIQEIPS